MGERSTHKEEKGEKISDDAGKTEYWGGSIGLAMKATGRKDNRKMCSLHHVTEKFNENANKGAL